MKASVIIPTRNRPDPLRRCLAGLLDGIRQVGPEAEVIVVDDGSEPRNAARIEEEVLRGQSAGGLRLHRLDRHLGVSAARNAGASRAAGDLLVFLDDDLRPEPEFLRDVLRVHREHPEALILCGHLFTRSGSVYGRAWENGYNQVFGRYDSGGEIHPVPTLSGGNVSVKRCVLDRIRPLFDPGLTSREDMDLFLRARDAGLIVYKTRLARAELEPKRTWAEFVRQKRWYAAGETALRAKHGVPRVLAAEWDCRIEPTLEMRALEWLYGAQRMLRALLPGAAP